MSTSTDQDTERSSLRKSQLIELLAIAGHEALRSYARERGDLDVAHWDDLDNRGRNRVRALVLALFTRRDLRADVEELLAAVGHPTAHQIGPEQP